MDRQISKKIEIHFDQAIANLENLELISSWLLPSEKDIFGSPYYGHEDLLKKHLQPPYDSMVYHGIMSLVGEKDFLKLKSKKNQESFFESTKIKYQVNYWNLFLQMHPEFEKIKNNIIHQISLKKSELIYKSEYCNHAEIE